MMKVEQRTKIEDIFLFLQTLGLFAPVWVVSLVAARGMLVEGIVVILLATIVWIYAPALSRVFRKHAVATPSVLVLSCLALYWLHAAWFGGELERGLFRVMYAIIVLSGLGACAQLVLNARPEKG
jgi:hypothetical protein